MRDADKDTTLIHLLVHLINIWNLLSAKCVNPRPCDRDSACVLRGALEQEIGNTMYTNRESVKFCSSIREYYEALKTCFEKF